MEKSTDDIDYSADVQRFSMNHRKETRSVLSDRGSCLSSRQREMDRTHVGEPREDKGYKGREKWGY